MKNIVLVLDPAHGINVTGKQSPDGKHREYRWSRDRVNSLRKKLTALGYEVYTTTDSENEPGLSKRRNRANTIRKGERKLLLSLHNDAAGADGKWHKARGASVWTTPGVTKSDICAEIILNQLRKDFPEVPIRYYDAHQKYGKDFEAKFTVLMGSDYMACLIEWLFQDNKEDVKLLSDEMTNQKYEESLIKAIEEINEYFA